MFMDLGNIIPNVDRITGRNMIDDGVQQRVADTLFADRGAHVRRDRLGDRRRTGD